jgi:hypothetical protein
MNFLLDVLFMALSDSLSTLLTRIFEAALGLRG